METFHFVQLRLFAPVPSTFQLPDGLVQEGHEELHRGKLGGVRVHFLLQLCLLYF